MKKYWLYAILLGAVTLTGCGSKTDANEKNFSNAIETVLEKYEVCMPFGKWPYRVMPDDKPRMAQMAALEAVGLVSGADFEAEQSYGWIGRSVRKIKLRVYSLTEQGKKFFVETKPGAADEPSEGHLCYGKLALDKVVKWQSSANQMMLVIYLTKMKNVADWAKNPTLLAGFPRMAELLKDGEAGKENDAILTLTNLGWEAGMLDMQSRKTKSGKIIKTPDGPDVNPADFLPVATPVTTVTPSPAVESAPPEKVVAPAPVAPVKPHPVQKPVQHVEKASGGVQVRQINLNE